MTTYVNGFDLGTVGAQATKTNITSSGYAFNLGGASIPVFTASDAIDGARAVELVRTSGSTFFYYPTAISTLDVSFSFMFEYKGSLPGTNDYLFDVRTSGGSLVRMITASTGIPFVQLSGVTISTGTIATAALVVNTQYRCDVRVHVNGSTGSINAAFYTPTGSSPIANLTFTQTSKNTGTSPIIYVYFGPEGSNTVSSGTFVLDLIRLDDSQSSTYFGPATGAPPTVIAGYFLPQSVQARGSFTLPGTPTWAAGHTGTVLWTGPAPITNATSNTATVPDIGSPSLVGGHPIKDDTVTYTFTATQDDAQTASQTVTATRICGNQWMLKGSTFQCAPARKVR